MTTSMMMYPAFETQHDQFLGIATTPSAYNNHSIFYNNYNNYTQQQQCTSPVSAIATSLASAVPEELRCQYSSKRCENHRTNKKSGGLHKFCAVHREKANRNQMRLDHRRRVLKRLAQRNGVLSSPSATSIHSSPYTLKTKKRSTSGDANDNDDDDVTSNMLLDIEDDLEIDLMPLALHRENNPANTRNSNEPVLDPQDLHILETLLFSDDDATDVSTASASHKQQLQSPQPPQRKKAKKTLAAVKTEDASSDDASLGTWWLNV